MFIKYLMIFHFQSLSSWNHNYNGSLSDRITLKPLSCAAGKKNYTFSYEKSLLIVNLERKQHFLRATGKNLNNQSIIQRRRRKKRLLIFVWRHSQINHLFKHFLAPQARKITLILALTMNNDQWDILFDGGHNFFWWEFSREGNCPSLRALFLKGKCPPLQS